MFSALIIDDECIFRQSLCTAFPWMDYGVEICDDCSTACEALASLEKNLPDIAFVDINLPGMNGLEFIQAAKKISPITNYVIISGYNDFSYAQEAISLGVTKYLLKPLKYEELKNTLEHILSQITLDHLNKHEITTLYERNTHYLHILRKQFLSNLISFGSKMTNDSIQENCEFLELPWHKKQYFYIVYMDTALEDSDISKITIENLQISEYLQANALLPFDGCACITTSNRVALLFTAQQPLTPDLMISELKKIQLCLFDLTNLNFRFGISKAVTQLAEIPRAATQAYEALTKYRLGSLEHIIFYDAASNIELLPTQKIVQFSICLKMENSEKVLEVLNDLKTELNSKAFTEQMLLAIQIDYTRCLLEIAHEHQLETLSEQFISEIHSLKQTITPDTLIQILIKQSNSLLDTLKSRHVQRHSPIVEQTVSYILEHISDLDLSVGTIAKALHVNYAHLCSIFSRDTNETINQYIKQQRLIKSRELMDSGITNISEIALAVGFQNANYFSKCFKKEFNVAPSDYLNSINKHH